MFIKWKPIKWVIWERTCFLQDLLSYIKEVIKDGKQDNIKVCDLAFYLYLL